MDGSRSPVTCSGTSTSRSKDGTILHLLMGKETHDNFRGFLLREELDDAADEAMATL
jgi:hypothetical protein